MREEKIDNKKPTMRGYLLRNIPEELWDQAKHKAVDEGLSLRDLLLKALREHLKEIQGAA